MAKISSKKIFVLDTSVLLHDHHSIVKFEENDVVIPITVLEELDKFKVGNEIKNFEASGSLIKCQSNTRSMIGFR